MNLFPCRVDMPDGSTLTDARITFYGAPGETIVWTWPRTGRPVAAATVIGAPRITSGPGERAAGSLVTAAGTITFREVDGCGCGAKLQTHTPRHPSGAAAARRKFVGT